MQVRVTAVERSDVGLESPRRSGPATQRPQRSRSPYHVRAGRLERAALSRRRRASQLLQTRRQQSRGVAHRQDVDLLSADPIDDAVVAEEELPHIVAGVLGHRRTLLRERGELRDPTRHPVDKVARIARLVVGDAVVQLLQGGAVPSPSS